MSQEHKLNLRSILNENKLTNKNHLDWERNLRIILRGEKKLYVIDEEPIPEPADNASDEEFAEYEKYKEDSEDVSCLILASISAELQKQCLDMECWEMITHLSTLFKKEARQERYELSKKLYNTKMADGSHVSEHVMKLLGYHDNLVKLGCEINDEQMCDIVLQSLPNSYSSFVLNHLMNNIEVSPSELHNMLKNAEPTIKGKTPEVLMVQKKGMKRKGHPKTKVVKKTRAAFKPKSSAKPLKEGNCFHCGEKGHWKRNCKKYLEELKKKRAGATNDPTGIYFIEVNNCSISDSWVLDTGAASHICVNMQGLKNRRKLNKGEVDLRVGNGSRIAALEVGNIELALPSGLVLNLENVYYVPAMSRNIISISCLDRIGFSIIIENNCCSIYLNDIFYCSASMLNGLYLLDLDRSIYNVNTKKLKPNKHNNTFIWHCRLGHINLNRMSRLHKDGLLDNNDFESFETCEPCLQGKMTKMPFTHKGERAKELLGIIHSDVCGPMSIQARGGFSYFITFTDDLSRYGYVYLIKHKSESFEVFKEFKNEVENQLGKRIKILRSDRGGEYLSLEFQSYLRDCGIVSQLTPPGTPQHNGVSERRNRTLLDMVRSMMAHTSLPTSFWGYALETAAVLVNNAPSKAVEKTPYEIWCGKSPNLKYLRVWGCEAYVRRNAPDKLQARSEKCVFVGYPKETKGYYFYYPQDNKVFVARGGAFLEEEFVSKEISGSQPHLDEIVEPNTTQPEPPSSSSTHRDEESQEVVTDNVIPTPGPRRSGRVRSEPERYGYLVSQTEDILLIDEDEPATYSEAMAGPESEKWLKAMNSEMDSMAENQVWALVDLPDGMRPIGCKWIFKKKRDMDGNVHIYKARLVAKGYRQIHGIDYDETFSPVAMIKSIRIMLAIAAYHDYEIWQMDVKTAFLNGNLVEDVYMTQPDGFADPVHTHKVCKLQRSIYGLKQASRSWNIRFDQAVKEFGFDQNVDEPCVYKKASGSTIVFLILYVDDILIMGNDIPAMSSVRIWLHGCFSMKDLGDATYILGIRIYRDRSRRLIGLSQSLYIDKVLMRFSMGESKKGFLPLSHGIVLSKEMCPKTEEQKGRMSRIPYASAIGSIMYAMLCTRPDVAFPLSLTSRYQSDPGDGHWSAVKNILKYLRKTKDVFLVYGGENELVVQGFTDASFQTDHDDFRSQSGFVFMLNGGAVSWKSSKQSTVADSSTEAEYIAASDAAKEAVWIRKFIAELGVMPSISRPIELLCDNNGAIAQAREPRSHQRSKHILRRFHLIRDIINRGDVEVSRVSTVDNIADPLTKLLSIKHHDRHVRGMGIRYIRDWI